MKYITLTEADYKGNDKYVAGDKVRVNFKHVLYYQRYVSSGYGKGGTEISKLIFKDRLTISVMETPKQLDKILGV